MNTRPTWKQASTEQYFLSAVIGYETSFRQRNILQLVIGYENKRGRVKKILVNFWTSLLKKYSSFKINAPLFRNVSWNKLAENMLYKACILQYKLYVCANWLFMYSVCVYRNKKKNSVLKIFAALIYEETVCFLINFVRSTFPQKFILLLIQSENISQDHT